MHNSVIFYILLIVPSFCVATDFIILEVDGFRAEGNFFYGNELCLRNSMTLPTPDTPEENKKLGDFLLANKIARAWIAVSDLGEEGKFRWLTSGQRVHTPKWQKNQPDNYEKNEHCIEVKYQDSVWGWNDLPCSTKFPIICQATFDIDVRFKQTIHL